MERHEWLAERFEAERAYVLAVACRRLGSLSKADDTVRKPGYDSVTLNWANRSHYQPGAAKIALK